MLEEMQDPVTLTTKEAAQLASVGTTTIKRWASQGLLPYVRTPGGHRRFERASLERLLRGPSSPVDLDALGEDAWVRCLVSGRRYEVDARLLEARERLGAWYRVADELAVALHALGKLWVDGRLSIAQEHVASDALTRALSRVADSLPSRPAAPACLFACTADEDHTLGLALAELCLREAGWTAVWLGRRTPVDEVIRSVREGCVQMVALSASAASADEKALALAAREVGLSCREAGVRLVLGGAGAWPKQPAYGVRLTSFEQLHAFVTGV